MSYSNLTSRRHNNNREQDVFSLELSVSGFNKILNCNSSEIFLIQIRNNILGLGLWRLLISVYGKVMPHSENQKVQSWEIFHTSIGRKMIDHLFILITGEVRWSEGRREVVCGDDMSYHMVGVGIVLWRRGLGLQRPSPDVWLWPLAILSVWQLSSGAVHTWPAPPHHITTYQSQVSLSVSQ